MSSAELPPGCASRFRPERLLASGGFGSVWKATQLALDRPAAIKVLHGQVASEADQVERFINEARVTAALTHPHIVVILDHGVENGVPWIAYEFIDGPSLRAVIAKGPMGWRDAMTAGQQVCSALETAHSQGIIHRDIKPDNILVASENHHKVADFGIARWRQAERSLTAAGMILGTPAYLSPTQIRSGIAGPESDIYALGATLYELVTGQTPFTSPSPAVLLRKHLSAAVVPASHHVEGLPPGVDRILFRALAKEREDRYATAAAMRADIEALLGNASPAAPIARPPGDPSIHASRRGALTTVGTMAVVAVLVLASAWILTARTSTPPTALASTRPAVMLHDPTFPGHRQLRVQLEGTCPPGAELIAVDGNGRIWSLSRITAAGSSETSGSTEALLLGLPAATKLRITLRKPGAADDLASLEVETPTLEPTPWVRLMEMDDRVQVEVRRPAKGELILELGQEDRSTVLQTLRVPAGTERTNHVIKSMRPETRYWIRGRNSAGWGGFDHFVFTTSSAAIGRSVRSAVEGTASTFKSLIAVTGAIGIRDRRLGVLFRQKEGGIGEGSSFDFRQWMDVATTSRDPENFDPLVTLLARTREADARIAVLTALVASDPSRAGPWLDRELPQLNTYGPIWTLFRLAFESDIALDSAGVIKVLESGREASPTEAAAVLRHDPDRALALYRRWLLGPETPRRAREVAIMGLEDLATDEAVSLLEGATRTSPDPAMRPLLLDSLSRIASARARQSVAELEVSPDAELAVMDFRILVGAPRILPALLVRARNREAPVRVSRILSLAEQPGLEDSFLEELLQEDQPRISAAVAWVVSQRATASASLIDRLRTVQDPLGVVGWSLARRHVMKVTDALRPVLEQGAETARRSPDSLRDPLSGMRLMLACWSAGLMGAQELAPHLEALAATRGLPGPLWTSARDALRWLRSRTPPRSFLLFPGLNRMRTGLLVDAGDTVIARAFRLDLGSAQALVEQSPGKDEIAHLQLGIEDLVIDGVPKTLVGRRRAELFISRHDRSAFPGFYKAPTTPDEEMDHLLVLIETAHSRAGLPDPSPDLQ